MGYDAKILCDSIANGVRLTTIQVTFPRIVLAELNTHKMLSKSSASSRAIPVDKQIARVLADPFVPAAFASNRSGMQAGEALSESEAEVARDHWITAMHHAVEQARRLAEIGVHKQWANRLIEPFAWHTVIVTGTDWANFFALRCSPMAQPEIRTAAEMMRDAMTRSVPTERGPDEWHLPLVEGNDASEIILQYDVETAAKISAARCARVSYLTHDGKRDLEADLALFQRLTTSGHWSPLEHVARPAIWVDGVGPLSKMHVQAVEWDEEHLYYGNLRGWMSLRKMMPGEDVFVPPQEPTL